MSAPTPDEKREFVDMTEREFEEQITLLAIATCRRFYMDTGNPIFVWKAYRDARYLENVPEWILKYFDDATNRLLAEGGSESQKAIAAAFGLVTPRGGPSAGRRARAVEERAYLRKLFAHLKEYLGLTADATIAEVADRVGRSPERIRNIVYGKSRT